MLSGTPAMIHPPCWMNRSRVGGEEGCSGSGEASDGLDSEKRALLGGSDVK